MQERNVLLSNPRKLDDFGVSQKILKMFYKNLVGSVLSLNMNACYRPLDVQFKGKLTRVIARPSYLQPVRSMGHHRCHMVNNILNTGTTGTTGQSVRVSECGE